MHKLEVKLKQHTPLIHFQHDQEFATLRASEVKPKLDRFILGKLSPDEKDEGRKAGWIRSSNNKEYLDYKMRITAEGEPKEFLIASLLSFSPAALYDSSDKKMYQDELPFTILGSSPFFAQENVNASNRYKDSPVFLKRRNRENKYDYIFDKNNWEKIDKKGLFWNALDMVLWSTHEELIKKLDAHLAEFFICTNFGTRSSKGFGSFTRIYDGDGQNSGNKDVIEFLKSNFKFVYAKNMSGSDNQKIFRTIKGDYQKLKSGTNRPSYSKSILFLYAVKKMEDYPRWEKRFFKQAVKDIMQNYDKRLHVEKDIKGRPHQPIRGYNDFGLDDVEEYKYYYLRAVLGLTEQYEFLLDYRVDNKWEKDNRQKLIVRPGITDVERYESPITVKVIDGYIYLVGNDVNENILNKAANIEYTIGDNKINENIPQKFIKLFTPNSFALSYFMKFAMSKEFNLGYSPIKEPSL